MRKIVRCVLFLLSCLAAGLPAQEITNDEIEIRKIIEQLTPMWTSKNGADVFLSISSETNFQFLSNASVLRRDGFVQMLLKTLADNPPTRHTHVIRKIVISNALAFEYGTLELVRANGQTMKSETLNVFFREASGWKLIGNWPVEQLRKTLQN